MDIQPLHHRPDGPPATESARDVERRRQRDRHWKRRESAARLEADPSHYIRLPSVFGCKACRAASVAWHVDKSKLLHHLQCGSCSYQRCSLVTEDFESKNVLRSWLARQLALDTNNAARIGFSAAPSHASTTAPCSSSTSTPMNSTSGSNPLVLTESLTDTTVFKSHDTITSAQPPIIDNSSIAQLHQLPGDDSSQSTGSKRPRDSDTMADHMMSDKTAKTARVDSNTGTDSDFAHYLTGLVSCHEQESTRLKDAMAERDEAVETIRGQSTLIAGLHLIRDEMGRRIWALETERDDLVKMATIKEAEAEKRCVAHRTEMEIVGKELETARLELKEVEGSAREISRVEIENMKRKYQETVEGLRLDLQKMDGQLVAGAKNTAHYRNEEQKALDSLMRIQAENIGLAGQVDQSIATHEYDVIQLEDAHTNQARLQAIVADLERCKAELTASQTRHNKLSTQHTQLSDELVDAEERIAQLQAKSNVTNDRLEEQQGLSADLSEANTKIERLEQEVVKLRIKVANAEMAEKTMTDSFEHKTGELNKDLEKAYQRMEKLVERVGRLRRREQQRRDAECAAETEDLIDLSLID